MRRRYVMGTFLSVQIAGENSAELETIFLTEVQRLEEHLSRYRPGSDVSRINRAAGREAIRISEDTVQIVEEALRFAVLSGGAFDPTVQPLGYQRVILNSSERTVFLEASGMQLDLGGIGKGFALDKALARVQMLGNPKSVSADFGGQLLFWQAGGLTSPETIVIENPDSRSAAMTFQMRSNGSVSTSSHAERSNHVIDPRSGQPARGAAGVTVVAPTAVEAEALSTALFVLGAVDGQPLIQTQTGVQAFFA